MKKFEYQFLGYIEEGLITKRLNELGEKGWELVSHMSERTPKMGMYHACILKREKPINRNVV